MTCLAIRSRLVVSVALGLSACADPVHDERVDELGPETPGVPEGELHRPGQPCLVCHGGRGPGSPTFDLAGTVFAYPDSPDPVVDAVVELSDANGRVATVRTNCAGNFYVNEGRLGVDFPLWVTVRHDDLEQSMVSPIEQDGSCAACHAEPPNRESPGQVYLSAEVIPNYPGGCK